MNKKIIFGDNFTGGDFLSFEIICITGEIEGHDSGSGSEKNTKYENLLPKLAQIEMDEKTEGILFIINTMGGDVSAGLAIGEMIAGLSKPTVSLVVGESHSIGVPIAVATDFSFIVKSATVVIHPVRMTGTILGTRQTYKQFKSVQDRIATFISDHSDCTEDEIITMMMETQMMSKDLGTILVGEEAVSVGLINEVGGIKDACSKLKYICQSRL